jgi:hypothetical protein
MNDEQIEFVRFWLQTEFETFTDDGNDFLINTDHPLRISLSKEFSLTSNQIETFANEIVELAKLVL